MLIVTVVVHSAQSEWLDTKREQINRKRISVCVCGGGGGGRRGRGHADIIDKNKGSECV